MPTTHYHSENSQKIQTAEYVEGDTQGLFGVVISATIEMPEQGMSYQTVMWCTQDRRKQTEN